MSKVRILECDGFVNHDGLADLEIWVVANKAYVGAGGALISTSTIEDRIWGVKEKCKVDGRGVLTVPDLALEATEDAEVNPDATLSAYLVTPDGKVVRALHLITGNVSYEFTEFTLPPVPSLTTWSAIAEWNWYRLLSAASTNQSALSEVLEV